MQKWFIFFLNFCIHFSLIFSKCRFNWCKISQKWKLWRFEMSLIYYLLNIFSFISFQSKNFWNLSKCQLFIQSFSELILILIGYYQRTDDFTMSTILSVFKYSYPRLVADMSSRTELQFRNLFSPPAYTTKKFQLSRKWWNCFLNKCLPAHCRMFLDGL